jgi:carbon monoxide dehydrogenase subunit G
MPRFSGEYEETFTVDAPIDRVKKHFSNVDAIVANYGPIRSHQRIDDLTVTLTLIPRSEKGVTFAGEYTCKYTFPTENTLQWSTIRTTNMWSSGKADFVAEGPNRTRVIYRQRIETEMQVNALLGKMISPIVSSEIRSGVKSYLERMRKSV